MRTLAVYCCFLLAVLPAIPHCSCATCSCSTTFEPSKQSCCCCCPSSGEHDAPPISKCRCFDAPRTFNAASKISVGQADIVSQVFESPFGAMLPKPILEADGRWLTLENHRPPNVRTHVLHCLFLE
jgi:hypothetical protein